MLLFLLRDPIEARIMSSSDDEAVVWQGKIPRSFPGPTKILTSCIFSPPLTIKELRQSDKEREREKDRDGL